MRVSSEAAVTAALWELLTADEELRDIFGGEVRVFLDWAEPDAEFPYLVHTLETDMQEPWPVQQGRYVLDVWDYAQTSIRIATIQRRVTELLARLWLPIDGGPDAVRFGRGRWRPMQEDTRYIWRRSSAWDVRFYASIEAQGILQRGGR